MKKNNWVYFVLAYIVVAILLSSYFYPRTRDEFYYLPNPNSPNPFREFYDSYFQVNPRIGQFFSNFIGRNPVLKPGFNVILFFGFMTAIFLLVFRKVPKIRNREDVWRFLLISAAFIFLINVFGEMFYYVPFNTNYTLTHVFYLLYLYLISEYYFYGRNLLEQKRIPYFLVFIGAFFMGWCNEHVPPVLLAGSFLLAFWYFIKNRKLPDFKILALNIPIFFGYLVLFLAPANSHRFEGHHLKAYGFQFSEYLKHWFSIIKFYYYFNFELLLFLFFAVLFILFNYKKIDKTLRLKIAFYTLLSIITLAIVAYSPLQGTRLIFFSNSLFIIIILFLMIEMRKIYHLKSIIFKIASTFFLIGYFSFSVFVTWKGNENYQKTIALIQKESEKSKDVILNESFDYSQGTPFARRILLESGIDYLDDGSKKEVSSQERLLKKYFGINSLSLKKQTK